MEWLLPLSWVGKTVSLRALPRDNTGKAVAAPTLSVSGRTLTVKGMPPGTPVILTI